MKIKPIGSISMLKISFFLLGIGTTLLLLVIAAMYFHDVWAPSAMLRQRTNTVPEHSITTSDTAVHSICGIGQVAKERPASVCDGGATGGLTGGLPRLDEYEYLYQRLALDGQLYAPTIKKGTASYTVTFNYKP